MYHLRLLQHVFGSHGACHELHLPVFSAVVTPVVDHDTLALPGPVDGADRLAVRGLPVPWLNVHAEDQLTAGR